MKKQKKETLKLYIQLINEVKKGTYSYNFTKEKKRFKDNNKENL